MKVMVTVLLPVMAVGAGVWLFSRGRSLQSLYQAEVRAELANHPAGSPPLLTEQDIAGLPPPVQRYFRANGYVGKPHTQNMRLRWKEMRLKRSQDADWMDLTCQQFNSVASPMRIALMKGRIAGFIPFEGRDKYQEGHGSMLIQAAKVFTVGDSTGTTMDTSGLVTVLSEGLMAPSYALQGYMKWQPVDDRTARAELTHNGLTVRGTFHFNEKDELIRFDTDDRWQDGTPPRRLPWSATLGDYRDMKGLRYPTHISATWHEPGGDLTYVEGSLETVEFNVKD